MPETTISPYMIAFGLAIFFTIIAAVLSLMGIWIKGFWQSKSKIMYLLTDLLFACIAALIALFLIRT